MKGKILSILLCLIMIFMLMPTEASAAECEAQHEDYMLQWYEGGSNIASHGSSKNAQQSQTGQVPSVYVLGGSGRPDDYFEVSNAYTDDWSLYWHMQDFSVVSGQSGKVYYPTESSRAFAVSKGKPDGAVLDNWQIKVVFDNGYSGGTVMNPWNVGMERYLESLDHSANWQIQYSEIYPDGLCFSKADFEGHLVDALLESDQKGLTGDDLIQCHFLYSTQGVDIEPYIKDVGMAHRIDTKPTLEFEEGYPHVRANSVTMTFNIEGKAYELNLMARDFGLTYHDQCYAIALGGTSPEDIQLLPMLTVRKTLEQKEGLELPASELRREFNFSLICEDENDVRHTCDLPYTKYASDNSIIESGVLTSVDKAYSFSIKGSEYITIRTPSTSQAVMSVSESGDEDYETSYKLESGDWTNGDSVSSIVMNASKTVDFKNVYTKTAQPALAIDKKVNSEDARTTETAVKPEVPATLSYLVAVTETVANAEAKNIVVADSLDTTKGVTINPQSFTVSKGQTALTPGADYTLSAAADGYTLTYPAGLRYNETLVISYTANASETAAGETVNTVKVNGTDPNAEDPAQPIYPEGQEPKDETHVIPVREEVFFKLTYHVIGDDTYGIPSDSVTPASVTDIPYDGSVDPLSDGPTTAWTTSDGTTSGLPGTWTFTEHWTEDDTNPAKADITDDKVENITEDKDVYGKWTFTPDYYHVTYVVAPDEKYGIPKDSVTPIDGTDYVYMDPVTVKDDLVTKQGYAIDPDTGNQVSGTWTFTPWDRDDFNITEDTEIHGAWHFRPDPVIPTGDSTDFGRWILLGTFAAAGIAAMFMTRKKKA